MRTEVGNHILLIPLHEQIHLSHPVGREHEKQKNIIEVFDTYMVKLHLFPLPSIER
jgi:hypothetical protein